MDTVAIRLRQAIYGLAFLLILGALAGGWLHYSPAPFWDMWGGTVHFVLRFESEASRVFFEQHNEHRLIWSRILFLIDYRVFGGAHVFLGLFNYACAFATWSVIWSCLKHLNQNTVEKKNVQLLAIVLGAWVFLWAQATNFTWAFQSQFHLAHLMPLIAFLSLSKAAHHDKRFSLSFCAAVLLGIGSAGTMANGVLALPLMAIWAVILRMRWWQIGILAVCGSIVLSLYLTGYHTPSSHGSVLSNFLAHPIDVLAFVFKYLGNPLVHVISPYGPGPWLAGLLGFGLTCASICLTGHAIRNRPENPITPGLTLFIIYVGASAFLTAGGRVLMGELVAYSSRYTTPTILAWTALICILSPWILKHFERSKVTAIWIKGSALLLLLGMFVPLIRMITPEPNQHHNRDVAVLALELGIADALQVGHVHPNARAILPIAKRASNQDIGIFGTRAYRGAREAIGTTVELETASECTVRIDAIYPIEGVEDYVRVSGVGPWPNSPRENARIFFLDRNHRIIGQGLRGGVSETAARDQPGIGKRDGFIGYVLAAETAAMTAAASDTCLALFNHSDRDLAQRVQSAASSHPD